MNFNPDVLEKFKLTSTPGGWAGASIQSWIDFTEYEPPKSFAEEIVSKKLVRSDINALRDDPKVSTFDLCVFILAWGEMHRGHAKDFIGSEQRQLWEPIAEAVRSGTNYQTGYERFFELTKAKKIKGCGPAYYTKLLFFLPPKDAPRGIIMDQWTARSINLLTQRQVVRLLPTGTGYRVALENDVQTYAEFCSLVAELSKIIHDDTSEASLEDIEQRLFSKGGRQKAPWRSFVASTSQTYAHGKPFTNRSGYVIIFKPRPNSPLSSERHLSSRIFDTIMEAEAARDRDDQRGTALDIVPVHWKE